MSALVYLSYATALQHLTPAKTDDRLKLGTEKEAWTFFKCTRLDSGAQVTVRIGTVGNSPISLYQGLELTDIPFRNIFLTYADQSGSHCEVLVMK